MPETKEKRRSHRQAGARRRKLRPTFRSILCTPRADLEGWDYDREVGYPGQFPYTRGVQATMYRGRLWTMRQYAGMGDAEESNRRYKYLLRQRNHRPVA